MLGLAHSIHRALFHRDPVLNLLHSSLSTGSLFLFFFDSLVYYFSICSYAFCVGEFSALRGWLGDRRIRKEA
jgi:hypothetical protein